MNHFKRRAGIIPALKRKLSVHRAIFISVEHKVLDISDRAAHVGLALGTFLWVGLDSDFGVNSRFMTVFNSPEQLVDLLIQYASKQHTTYVIGYEIQHAVQILDLPRLFSERGFHTELPLMSSWSFIWNIEHDGSHWTLLDSNNIFQVSIEKLGQSIALKLRPFDEYATSDAELTAYSMRKTLILERAFILYWRFLLRNNLGYFCTTVAWQAMTAYRTRFMDQDIHIHTDYDVLKLERKGYFGARNEAFYIGVAPNEMWFAIDVNSMYANIMLKDPMPVRLIGDALCPSLRRLSELIGQYHIVADVDLRTELPIYPKTIDKKLVFPLGNFRTVLHSAELAVALERDHIAKIHEIAWYDTSHIFGDYVDFFYHEKAVARENGNRARELMAKMFLNGLYGKFAQEQTLIEHLGKSWFDHSFCEPCVDLNSGLHWEEFHWFGERYLVLHKGEKPYTFPAISGAITSYARVFLWDAICKSGRQNVLYCDTDSLIVNYAGMETLKGNFDTERLGAWKLVDMSDNVRIFGKKDYQFGPTVKFAGLKGGSIRIGENVWKTDQYRSFNRALKQGYTGRLELTKVTKRREYRYTDDLHGRSGWIAPIRLEEFK